MKRTRTATIDYHGVPLVVQFSYYGGFAGTLEMPPEPETADLSSIKAGAVEISEVFNTDQLDEIETACIEWVHEDREFWMHEHADMLREERALGNA